MVLKWGVQMPPLLAEIQEVGGMTLVKGEGLWWRGLCLLPVQNPTKKNTKGHSSLASGNIHNKGGVKEPQVGTFELFSLLRIRGGCEWFWVALGQSKGELKINPSRGKWSYLLCSDSSPGLLLSVPSLVLSPGIPDSSEVVKGQWRDVVDQGEKRSRHPFSAALVSEPPPFTELHSVGNYWSMEPPRVIDPIIQNWGKTQAVVIIKCVIKGDTC